MWNFMYTHLSDLLFEPSTDDFFGCFDEFKGRIHFLLGYSSFFIAHTGAILIEGFLMVLEENAK